MTEFVHLHNHTDYSLLDGAANIPRLVDTAIQQGMKALAITDHGNMFGVLRFYSECRNKGIKPIIGCEFYVAPGSMLVKSGNEKGTKYNHLILLAKNSTGYANLMILASIAYTDGFYYKPRIDFETLKKYSEGLICSSACIAGIIPRLILQGNFDEAEKTALEYQEVFGKDHYYLELQDHGIEEQKIVNKGLIRISEKTGIPLIATNDIHYITKEEAEAQEILICIGTQKKLSDRGRLVFDKKEFYMKDPDTMMSIFRHVPQAIENTNKVADMCNLEIKLPGPLLPDFKIPEQFANPDEYLRHITYEGLNQRYGEITEKIKSRAEFELNIIISMGFTGYFLIVWDFIHWAKENDIPVGPGRGSGAGSLVAYAMTITDIDPFKYDLLFERFLNPERVSMPDFDIDFCFERRQEVIDYVTRKYGSERVGQIITFGTLKTKAVLKDVARVLDIPFDESNAITKMVPADVKKLKDAIEQEEELQKVESRGGVYEKLITISKYLEGLNRHSSLHAAGIVIGKEELTKYVPLYKDPKTGAVSTQFTMDQLEECGLVKMDFLGLKTLTLIKNTENLIKKRGIDFDISKIPEDDEKTFKMLGEGKSACIFQFESSGMQKILKDAQPETIEDLIALNALYRPGPMANIPQFIESKKDKSKIKYPDPSLEEVLKPTYGVIVYQEQVMKVAQIIGGFSLGKADILRRAMGKKKLKEMEKMKVEFLKGAVEKGFNEKHASEIFDMLEPFAGYGFNKSHAAAYSVLAYQTAYLKANYPSEFMAANLTNEIRDTDKMAEYIAEARQMGIEMLPPDINLSEKYFTVSEGKIVYGLIGIKNVGTAAVDEIIREKSEGGNFKNLKDMLDRVDLRVVNKKVLETLIKSGLFDSIEPGRALLFHNLDRLVESASRDQENRKFGQTSLFGGESSEQLPEVELEHVPEWPERELLNFEKENLGFYFSGHPLKNYRKIYDKSVTLRLTDFEKASADKKYTVLGVIKSIREFTTKAGKQMGTIVIETFEGEITIVFFNSTWIKFRYLLEEDKVLGFVVKADKRSHEPKLLCENVINPDDMKEATFKEVHFAFKGDFDQENLDSFKSFLLENSGPCTTYIHIKEGSKVTVLKAPSQLNLSSSDEVIKTAEERYNFISSVWKE